MKTVFAVFKEAAYRHECGGIFETSHEAIEAAQALLASEPDAHHWYEVVPFELGVSGSQISQRRSRSSALTEPAAIAKFKRRPG